MSSISKHPGFKGTYSAGIRGPYLKLKTSTVPRAKFMSKGTPPWRHKMNIPAMEEPSRSKLRDPRIQAKSSVPSQVQKASSVSMHHRRADSIQRSKQGFFPEPKQISKSSSSSTQLLDSQSREKDSRSPPSSFDLELSPLRTRSFTIERNSSEKFDNIQPSRKESLCSQGLQRRSSSEEERKTGSQRRIEEFLSSLNQSELLWPNRTKSYFALADKVNYVPLSHLLSPPFSKEMPGVCEVIGPPLVVCLMHNVLGLTLSVNFPQSYTAEDSWDGSEPSWNQEQNKHYSKAQQPSRTEEISPPRKFVVAEPKVAGGSLPFRKGITIKDSSSPKGAEFGLRNYLPSRESSQPSIPQDNRLCFSDSLTIPSIAAEESIETLYVSPQTFSQQARRIFGEQPPTIIAVLMAAWNEMMLKGCEQAITLFGNIDMCKR